jgi:hypothetical protein
MQIFLYERQSIEEISKLQSLPDKDWDNKLIDEKHKEHDKYTHMINLFFESIGM